MRLLFATTNPHKLEEVRAVFASAGIEVIGLDALSAQPEQPEETEATFAGNARLKARHYATATGMRCLAEDSGLEVDALDGAPGVRSARYAGKGRDRAERDRANNAKLLEALRAVPEESRTARFVCAMCVADSDGSVLAETRGHYEGVITTEPRGQLGFGYDPLLYLPDAGKTSAQLSPEEKNARSHRGSAARAMAQQLRPSG